MKQTWMVGALVALLISGCAPKPKPQGGSFDEGAVSSSMTGGDSMSGAHIRRRELGPPQRPLIPDANELSPGPDRQGDSGPEYIVPHTKYRTIEI